MAHQGYGRHHRNPSDDDDLLAYGDFHDRGVPSDTEGGNQDRGFIGDLYNRVRGTHSRPPGDDPNTTQSHQPQFHNQDSHLAYGDPQQQSSSSVFGMSGLFDKIHESVHSLGSDLKDRFNAQEQHGHTHESGQCVDNAHSNHRFGSFAPQRQGNDIKWYVDGCGYMWAVSMALERAQKSVWILDWWLSPELYLRRPPAKNEEYRVDRMLHRAAERGVKVNIIVYKEVTQALTLSSSHTKHHLEDLHPNIAVFRHPDHLPDAQAFTASFVNQFKNLSLNASSASKLPGDALKAIYGSHEDTVLYWAHHEKLCLIDGETAFMGGLDLCYGRWDTYSHPIADAHPGNLDDIVFPGQDFNDARVMDFQDVENWQNNKLDRKTSSRMGWSDVALSIHGPVVTDLAEHFIQRWNFIFDDKYSAKNEDSRYSRLTHAHTGHIPREQYQEDEGDRGLFTGHGGGHEGKQGGGFKEKMRDRMDEGAKRVGQKYGVDYGKIKEGFSAGRAEQNPGPPRGPVDGQLCRSCAQWSHNCSIEHSIANAYIEIIRKSKHFVYMENQFFITATHEKQAPIKNRIGAAIVERILRAARNGENYKIFIMIPAVPGFAGDLKSDDALGTRAIMEFQYNSICRGGYSIYETLSKEGVDPVQFIRFYNLRNYDRINSSGVMKDVENTTGVDYEDARRQHDERYGGHPIRQEYGEGQSREAAELPADPVSPPPYQGGEGYQAYQEGASKVRDHRKGLGTGRWDSVSECYMLGGKDIREVPWEGGDVDEIDAFVSEELYLHSKLLIADDRIVICGSANLNDRSQLGDHDSEIAMIIEDPTPLDSYMNGERYQASRFAATLRRQVFRKHLGLLPPQDYTRPDDNFQPVGYSPNAYEFGSEADDAVIDPLSSEFQRLWNTTARNNTEAFDRAFHVVPTDKVRNWKDYDEFFEKYFAASEESKKKIEENGGGAPEGKYKWGHVVRDEFPGGVSEVKELLSTIRGTLVEMPLLFLKEEDIAKEGLGLNAFTEEVYT